MRLPLSLIALFIIVCIGACKPKTQDLSGIQLGYDYYPNRIDSYIVYEVDSTWYGLVEENFTYQIKEIISEQFVDDTGQPAVRVERFLRHFPNQPWVLIDVWVQKRTPTTAERVEENVRYIKLEFPVENGGSWLGNTYNTHEPWTYTYEQVDEPVDIGELEFARALKVNQRYYVNLVEQQIAYEIYAYDIGMVYKQNTNVTYQSGDPSGYDVRYRAISYSH
ncbi:MAG: hypothetical protein ACKVOR_04675 [Flavobacteriales bacterium]